MKAAIVLLLLAHPAWARCRHAVGRDPCVRFGAWATHVVPIIDTVEMGTTADTLAPVAATAVVHPDGTAATLGPTSGNIVATGVHMRVLLSLSEHAHVGVETFPGTVLATHATMSVDGMPATIRASTANHLYAIAGLHVGGDIQVGIELAAGVRATSFSYAIPAGDTGRAPGGLWHLGVEGRGVVRAWIGPGVTIAASAGADVDGDLAFAVDFGVHFTPYDGR